VKDRRNECVPGVHISRQAAQEALFPNLGQPVATRELYKVLSMARAALSVFGASGASFLRADRTHIWVDPACPLEIDFRLQTEALRRALLAEAGTQRDDLLVAALAEEGTLLEGEPVAEWAVRAREQLEWSRQEARLVLARDRARGFGRSSPEGVVQAWEECLAHDPVCEEAASALIRRGRRCQQAVRGQGTGRRFRCRAGARTRPISIRQFHRHP
jgi:DNA-binding SARP family transcriptional activator